jgi:L-2-hydroxyglutarate oxidase LhgO
MREYCATRGLRLNPCGKLVVATCEEDLHGLAELKRRADANGVELIWVNEKEIAFIDPHAKTYRKALYSPSTATVDPLQICRTMRRELMEQGVEFRFNTRYAGRRDGIVVTNRGRLSCGYVVNAAGLYADKIARDYGFGESYTIIPFKGLYVKYEAETAIRTNIYPVPQLANPFLGVHFTKTVDGSVKIGPTAIPALWREQYAGFGNFKLRELAEILYYETKLFATDAFGFRKLAFDEMKKYWKPQLVRLAMKLVRDIDPKRFGGFTRPGIRAQLIHKKTLELVQDFVVEGDGQSIHVLNAVSPAFTCSIPFARYVVDKIIEKRGGGAR